MSHSRLIQHQMHDWIVSCLENGKPTPTDQEICDRFAFTSPVSARTLLADLAEAGRITIKGHGAERIITLGKEAPSLPASPRPARAVRKPDISLDRDAAKILAIVKRGRPPVPEVATPVDDVVASPADAASFIGSDDDLVGQIMKLVAELAARADVSAQLAEAQRDLAAMTERAEAAEARLAHARQALAA